MPNSSNLRAEELDAEELEANELEADELEADELEADELEANELEANELEVVFPAAAQATAPNLTKSARQTPAEVPSATKRDSRMGGFSRRVKSRT